MSSVADMTPAELESLITQVVNQRLGQFWDRLQQVNATFVQPLTWAEVDDLVAGRRWNPPAEATSSLALLQADRQS